MLASTGIAETLAQGAQDSLAATVSTAGGFEEEAFQVPWLAQGGDTPGAFATTPDDDAYLYVTPDSAPAAGGNIGALMAGSKWSSFDAATQKTVVTYSFANPSSSMYAYADMPGAMQSFSDADRQVTRDVLAKIAAVCNVQFVEVADDASQCGVIRYAYSGHVDTMGYAGYAYFPSSQALGGDVWIATTQSAAQWDFYRADLILHETLHALGLKHPFDSGATLPPAENIIPNTVMSYSPLAGASNGWMSAYPTSPMAMDIAALQYMYGSNAGTNAANSVYNLAASPWQSGFQVVWDGGGSDSFDAASIAHGVTLDLAEGAMSNVGAVVRATGLVGNATISSNYSWTLSIAQGTVIENAVGTNYADTISGNASDNWMQGNAGNDTLDGRGGNDVLDGGNGIDTALYAASRASASVAKSGTGYLVSGPAGTDSLTAVERVQFNDGKVALDLDGHAGTVARILGAVFGAEGVHNAQYVGIGLQAADSGMTQAALAQLALDARLGSHADSKAIVDLLWTNVVGAAPSQAVEGEYVAALASGTYTPASLVQLAAETGLNADHIGLVGLAATGLDYA